MSPRITAAERRFSDLVDTTHQRLLAYAVRRTDVPADAADIVAETYLVAWRRIEDIPEGEADTTALHDIPSSDTHNTTDTTPVPTLADRRRRRLGGRAGVTAGLVALTAVGGTAAAITLLQPAPEIMGMACEFGNVTSVLPPGASSPIERCTELASRSGQPVPDDLVLYTTANGFLTVRSRAEGLPADATIIEEPQPDVRLLELRHTFIDQGVGVGFEADAPCRPMHETAAAVQTQLTRLGLTDYTTTVEDLEPGASDDCVTASVAASGHAVTLQRRLPPAAEAEAEPSDPMVRTFMAFHTAIQKRSKAMAQEGASAEELADMVRTTAAAGNVPADAYAIDIIPTPVGDTARLYLESGGMDFIHIYSPTATGNAG